MIYRELFSAFSKTGIGALLLLQNRIVTDINERGWWLLGLQAEEVHLPVPLAEIFPADMTGEDSAERQYDLDKNESAERPEPLSEEEKRYYNPLFGTYLTTCGWLGHEEVQDLQRGMKILLFRNAYESVENMMLKQALNHVREAVTIWDDQGRMLMLNDATLRHEIHTKKEDIGNYVEEMYEVQNNSILAIPEVLKTRKPLLNLRQDFETKYGKTQQIVSDNYPIMGNGQMLGAFSIMDDYTAMDALSRQVTELQQRLAALGREKKRGSSPLEARYRFDDIMYASNLMNKTVKRCKMVARSDSHVMIYGETGTGKELFAQSIHNASPRSGGPFLAVNCAAIPTTLLESILFGTEKGAYTGSEKREGLFEQANHGTLLLDELNSMDITLQSKLLRVIQEGMFFRVGGSRPIQVDVRIISNINMEPQEAIENKLLRSDLYYRLGVIVITVPPLRNRKEDIYVLSKNFIMEKNKTLLKNASYLSATVEKIFQAYDWPGNVRELQHAIEYALNIIPEEMGYITAEYIPDHILSTVGISEEEVVEQRIEPVVVEGATMEEVLQEAGRQFLKNKMEQYGGNITKVAEEMGITRQNLQHRLKKYGLK